MCYPHSNPAKNHDNCDESRRLFKFKRGGRKKSGPRLQSSRNCKLERKVVNAVSDEHRATGYPTFWNYYSQYSRFKPYPCDKIRNRPADHYTSKSRDRSREFSCWYDLRVYRLQSCSLTHLIPTRITRVSQNRKIFRSPIKSPKPVANLRCQTESKWSACRFNKMALIFRDLLKNNKKEYTLVQDSLDFILFRD